MRRAPWYWRRTAAPSSSKSGKFRNPPPEGRGSHQGQCRRRESGRTPRTGKTAHGPDSNYPRCWAPTSRASSSRSGRTSRVGRYTTRIWTSPSFVAAAGNIRRVPRHQRKSHPPQSRVLLIPRQPRSRWRRARLTKQSTRGSPWLLISGAPAVSGALPSNSDGRHEHEYSLLPHHGIATAGVCFVGVEHRHKREPRSTSCSFPRGGSQGRCRPVCGPAPGPLFHPRSRYAAGLRRDRSALTGEKRARELLELGRDGEPRPPARSASRSRQAAMFCPGQTPVRTRS